MQIVRKSSLTATPWKNGGGVTREVMRVPLGSEVFRWRLSIAQIDVSGPFSDFTGYDRKMVLLQGQGVRLVFGQQGQKGLNLARKDIAGSANPVFANPVSLRTVGDMAEFDGALETDCQLLNGPCTDLNLMVAQSLPKVTARVEAIRERRVLPASHAGVTLVFGISGSVCLSVDRDLAPPIRLGPWDLAVLPVGGGGVMAPVPDQGSSALVFSATVDDNSA